VPVEAFYSYAREDHELRDELEKHSGRWTGRTHRRLE
jgi:hypothetical protein